MSSYPKTLVNRADPTGEAEVVFTSEEEDTAKKAGFGGPYKHQGYPKMLYKGKVQAAGKEQDPKTILVVNNPDEEAEANRDGFKAAGSKPTSVKKS